MNLKCIYLFVWEAEEKARLREVGERVLHPADTFPFPKSCGSKLGPGDSVQVPRCVEGIQFPLRVYSNRKQVPGGRSRNQIQVLWSMTPASSLKTFHKLWRSLSTKRSWGLPILYCIYSVRNYNLTSLIVLNKNIYNILKKQLLKYLFFGIMYMC